MKEAMTEKSLNGEGEVLIAVFNAYIEAINTHEYAQVSNLLHENAVFCVEGQIYSNAKEVEAFHENFWNTLKDSKYWAAAEAKIIYHDSRCHVCTYPYNYSGYIDGKYIEGGGITTDMYVYDDKTKQWKLIHEHSSQSESVGV